MSLRVTPAITSNVIYITSRQIRERFGGRGELWITRQIETNGFPKPVRFGNGRLLYWKLSEVEEWERSRAQVA